jgi:D-alanyl-D-alanine carboxypeptidase
MKTGFTQASGFNLLASCHRDDKHLIAVVLGGRSSRERNARMRSLLDQSWGKAVALNELKQRGKDAPALVAGILASDLMPERNPAFHSNAAERLVAVAIDQAEKQHNGAKAEEAGAPRAALAAMAPPQAEAQKDEDDEDAAEAEEEVAEGDAAVDTAAEADSGPRRDGVSDGASLGPYHVQVGSFLDVGSAKERLELVAGKASGLMKGHGELTVSGEVRGKSYYRARFGQFSRQGAAEACVKLKQLSIECMIVRVE